MCERMWWWWWGGGGGGGGGGEEREKVARMRVTTKPGLWTGLQHCPKLVPVSIRMINRHHN